MPAVDLQTETLETRLERLVIAFLKDNVNTAPAGGFRHMDQDTEPAGDYCSVSAKVDEPEPEAYGPRVGWKGVATTIEYRRGNTVESDAQDIDSKTFDARWARIVDALDTIVYTDLVESLSVNTVNGYPQFIEAEERDTEDSEKIRRKSFFSISGLADPNP